MKQICIIAWAWIMAHPAETLAALYVALNAVNAAIPVERRKTSRLARVLDALCIVTQRGAENATSWPVVGRSIARDLVTLSIAPPKPEDKKSEPGFVHIWTLAAIAIAVILIGLVLVPGCSSSQSIARAVQPIALHEVQHPEYGACHEVGARAASRTLGRELVIYAGACLGRIDGGAAQDAAVVE